VGGKQTPVPEWIISRSLEEKKNEKRAPDGVARAKKDKGKLRPKPEEGSVPEKA